MKKCRLSSTSGDALLMLVGTIGIMLIMASVAVSAAYFYAAKASLEKLSRGTALFAASSLPDPRLAGLEAMRYLGTFGLPSLGNLELGSISGKIKFETIVPTDADPAATTYVEWCSFTAPTYSCSPSSSSSPRLPIGSIVIELSATTQRAILNSWIPSSVLTVRAESAAHLVPTDVMLVVENSNSLISRLDGEANPVSSPAEAAAPPGAFNTSTFDLNSQTLGPPDYLVNLGTVWARQCFGKTVTEIKKAALKAYDVLTSSSSFRVGVIHTPDTVGGTSGYTIALTGDKTDPYFPYPTATPGLAPLNGGPNESLLSVGAPESRCAALTSPAPTVPPHPFAQYIPNAASIIRSNLTSLLVTNPTPAFERTFAFTSSARLVPRELIWLASAGSVAMSGLPLPQYTHNQAHLAIQRAIDILRTAPARADNLAVRRKVVLVFVDGYDNSQASYYKAVASPEITGNKLLFSEYSSAGPGSTPAAPQSNLGTLTECPGENYCEPSCAFVQPSPSPAVDLENSIYNATSNQAAGFTDSPNDGVKVNILLFPTRDTTMNVKDPYYQMVNLPGHNPAASPVPDDIQTLRRLCNEKWSNYRGFSVLEYSRYDSILVPAVIRSLSVAELDE